MVESVVKINVEDWETTEQADNFDIIQDMKRRLTIAETETGFDDQNDLDYENEDDLEGEYDDEEYELEEEYEDEIPEEVPKTYEQFKSPSNQQSPQKVPQEPKGLNISPVIDKNPTKYDEVPLSSLTPSKPVSNLSPYKKVEEMKEEIKNIQEVPVVKDKSKSPSPQIPATPLVRTEKPAPPPSPIDQEIKIQNLPTQSSNVQDTQKNIHDGGEVGYEYYDDDEEEEEDDDEERYSDEDEDIADDEEISDVDDAELLRRLDEKYGKLPPSLTTGDNEPKDNNPSKSTK